MLARRPVRERPAPPGLERRFEHRIETSRQVERRLVLERKVLAARPAAESLSRRRRTAEAPQHTRSSKEDAGRSPGRGQSAAGLEPTQPPVKSPDSGGIRRKTETKPVLAGGEKAPSPAQAGKGSKPQAVLTAKKQRPQQEKPRQPRRQRPAEGKGLRPAAAQAGDKPAIKAAAPPRRSKPESGPVSIRIGKIEIVKPKKSGKPSQGRSRPKRRGARRHAIDPGFSSTGRRW